MAPDRFDSVADALRFFGVEEDASAFGSLSRSDPIAALVACVRSAVRRDGVDVRTAVARLAAVSAELDPAESRRAAVLASAADREAPLEFREDLVARFLLSVLLREDAPLPTYARQKLDELERASDPVKINSLRNFLAQVTETFPDVARRAELEGIAQRAEAHLVRVAAPIASRRGAPRSALRRCVGIIAHVPASIPIASHTGLLVAELLGLARAAPELEIHLLVTGESSFSGPLVSRLPQLAEDRSALLDRFRREAGPFFERNLFVPEVPVATEPDSFAALGGMIRDLSPDVVLCWGGIFESRVWRRAAFESYPLVFLPFNHKNWVGPEADVVLSLGRDAARVRSDDPRARPFDFPVSLPPRAHVGTFEPFPEGRKGRAVVISAFASGRFESAFAAYDDATVDALVGFLDTRPEVVWLFVGIVDEARIVARGRGVERLVAEGRIRLLPFQVDLRAVYAAGDVYAHLPAFGGGGVGGLMAIDAGLPLVCFHDSDVAHYAGDEDVFTDLGAFLARIATLCTSVEERKRHAARQHRLAVERHSPEHSGPQLLQHCEEALTLGLRRLGGKARAASASPQGGRRWPAALRERVRAWFPRR